MSVKVMLQVPLSTTDDVAAAEGEAGGDEGTG